MTRHIIYPCLAALLLLAASPLSAQDEPAKPEPKQVLFTNVRIFNGVDEKLTEGDVLVENNLIKKSARG